MPGTRKQINQGAVRLFEVGNTPFGSWVRDVPAWGEWPAGWFFEALWRRVPSLPGGSQGGPFPTTKSTTASDR